MNEDAFRSTTGVSRETTERLRRYGELLARWNQKINLVGPSTVREFWHRHALDSAQLWPLVSAAACTAVDLGSGAGFPALVLAILAREKKKNGLHFNLIEADCRKAAFLSTVVRDLSLPATVVDNRVECVEPPAADLVTARAFAPLTTLIAHTHRMRNSKGQALFLKGRTANKELDDARRLWNFEYRLHPSQTARDSVVVEIGAIHGPKETVDPRAG